MKFSVIVPVYKVEGYLEQCVESVLQQTYTDFELILVDDGSPDRCPEMCDNFSQKDTRIKVIHKKNGGLSSARNAGLDIATGDYVVFLDSDDFWNDENALQEVYDKAKFGTDIVIFGCTDWDIHTNKKVVSRSSYNQEIMQSNDKNMILHYLLSEKKLPGGSTVFMTRRKIIQRNSIAFKEGINSEDYDWVLEVFLNSDSFAAIDNPFYTYRKGRIGSITTVPNMKTINGIIYTVEKWIEKANTIDNDTIKRDVLNYLAHIYTTGVVMLARLKGKDKKMATKRLKVYEDVLKAAYWKKTKAVRFSLAIFGYMITAYMTNKAFRIRRAMVMKS